MKFRGHETFFIRKGWLYKGMKNVTLHPYVFTDKELNPMDVLGMGANMVKSLRYWMQAAGLATEFRQNGRGRGQQLTDLAKIIYQYDPYMEETGTQCLIHYKIASSEKLATSWYFFFNHFQMEEYQKEDFLRELRNYTSMHGESPADSSMEDDFNCIVNTYVPRKKLNPGKTQPESNIESPLDELGLIDITNKRDRVFKTVPPKTGTLPSLIAMAMIVEQNGINEENSEESYQIPIEKIQNAPCSLGRIFHLDIVSLISILDQLDHMGLLKLVRTAGMDVVNIPENLTFSGCVRKYYESLAGNIE